MDGCGTETWELFPSFRLSSPGWGFLGSALWLVQCFRLALRLCRETLREREACRSETAAQQQPTERPLCVRPLPSAHGSERWHWCRAAAQETGEANKPTGLLSMAYQTELRGNAVVEKVPVREVKTHRKREVTSGHVARLLLHCYYTSMLSI